MKGYKLDKLLYCFFSLLFLIQSTTVLSHATVQESDTVQVPIIMYHSLLNKEINQWNISPDAFEEDLKYLSENGYKTVFISDLIAYVYEGIPLPEKPVVLTFDDGYYNNYSIGMPLLKKYDMKIMVSVIGDDTDHWTAHADETSEQYGHLTWPQISKMVETGHVEFANHTQSLHKNTNGRTGCCRIKEEDVNEYERLLAEDVEILQDNLEKISGIRPECFTYPFGSKCKESVDILKKLGFKATLSCVAGINNLYIGNHECLLYMKRNNRTPKQSVETILKKFEAAQ